MQHARNRSLAGTSVPESDIRMVAAIFAICIAVGLLGGILFGGESAGANNPVGLVALIGSCVLVLFGVEEFRRTPIQPFSFFVLATLIYYGMRGAQLQLGIVPTRLQLPLQHISEACLMVAASVPLCFAGYSSNVGKTLAERIPLMGFPEPEKRYFPLWVRAVILFGIGAATRLFLISQGVFHVQRVVPAYLVTYGSWFEDVASFTDFSCLAMAALYFRRQCPGILLGLALAGDVALGALHGGATKMVMPFVTFGMVYALYARPLRWRQTLAAGALAILVLSPLAYAYRAYYYRNALVDAPGAAYAETAAQAMTRDVSREIEDNTTNVLDRFGQLDGLLVALDRVPRLLPYQNGSTFVPQVIAMPIPRFLWPNKPKTNPGRQFAIDFYDDPNLSDIGNNLGIGMVAEVFYNFSFWGLLVYFPMGVMIRFFWTRMQAYLRMEACASARIPYVFLFVPAVTAPLAMYFGGLVRFSVSCYLYMVLLYGTIPVVQAIRRKAPVPRFAAPAPGLRRVR